MPLGSKSQRELMSNFFNPGINAETNENLREWLKSQDANEIELFLEYFDFSQHKDKEIVLRQELDRRRRVEAQRASWIDRGVSFAIGVVTAVIGAIAYSFLVGG